jgi:hypothetical protein
MNLYHDRDQQQDLVNMVEKPLGSMGWGGILTTQNFSILH